MSHASVTTADQLLHLREPGFRHELVRGELQRMTLAGWLHGIVAGEAAVRLSTFVERHHLGLVFAAGTGFYIERDPDTVLAPDAAFVHHSRLAHVTEDGFFVGAPDLAVEVKSPDESHRSLRRKANAWVEGGAREVWVVDPKARTVDVLRDDGERLRHSNDDEIDGGQVLPGLRLRVGDLFPSVPQQ